MSDDRYVVAAMDELWTSTGKSLRVCDLTAAQLSQLLQRAQALKDADKPAFSDFQLKCHLYGSENSQG